MRQQDVWALSTLRERKAAQMKVALAFETLDLLTERSLSDVSVRELCDRLQISETTFFNYYGKKTDLILYLTQLITIELVAHAQRVTSDGVGIAFIHAIYDYAAALMAEYPWGIQEIFGHQTLLRTIPELETVTPLALACAYPNIGTTLPRPMTIRQIFDDQLKKSIQIGELPADTDHEALSMTLYSIFFAVPIALTWDDPGKVAPAYRAQLAYVWKGAGAIIVPAASALQAANIELYRTRGSSRAN
jgi:AcrR family transcriptional regulator